MKKRFAVSLVIVMFLNILFGSFMIQDVYADTAPTINKITIKEEVEVVGGVKTTKYQVIFNGYPMTNIDAIHVVQGGAIKKTLPKEEFSQINSANIAYIPQGAGQSIQSIFGATGQIYFSVVRNGQTYPADLSNPFDLPNDNFMKIDTISGLSPASWPVTVIKGTPFTIEGSHFSKEAYRLGITTGDSVTTEVGYDVVGGSSTQIQVGTDTINIAAGSNQNFVFERSSGSNVEIRYIIKKAISVANPLNLGNVSVSPLQGTEGTLVRIRAENHVPLLDIGTKIFIGGVEAKRNISEFSDGTFSYIEGGLPKKGLEVVVPKLATAGEKPILFKNFDNDTYAYPQNFNYVFTAGSVLQIIDTDINKAFTNKEENVPNIRIRNAVSVNNIPDKGTMGTPEVGTSANLNFFKDLDPKSYYIKYALADGKFIERKITLSIGLKASITNVPLSWDIQDITALSAMTDKVSQSGDYTVTARTETVHYSFDGSVVTELNYVVEEAPFGSQTKVTFKFEPDLYTPAITKITPTKGPHDQYITATLQGQNFRVENVGGVTTFPTIILGSQTLQGGYKYKMIQKTIENGTIYNRFFNSNDNNGNWSEEIIPVETDPVISMVVLDAAGNVVDGQARKSGTQVKFSIPKGMAGVIGFADVTVYNPNPLGGLGGKDTKETVFEYVVPAPGALLPQITSVTPDKVGVGKMEEITLKGKNFQPGILVTVDGEIIQNPTVDIVKGTIVFKVPVGRQGKTYIQVINPDGGFASADFEYIQTFSQPVLSKVIPNFGAKGNLVIIKGGNFYPANPEGENADIKIGTKVYIDGKDINKLYYDVNGNPQDFVNEFDENKPIYGPNWQPGDEPLKSYGSNVTVVDNETIYFVIPDPKDPAKSFFLNEWLDIKVVNPDLGKAEIKKGFKILDVVKGPKIDNVDPILGDYRGGNIAEITGENFLENVKVYFGSQEAQVYRRSNNARSLWVYIPPYGGDLADTNRAVVPVTVLNSDGGSHTKYDGYTYVNPGYTPKITAINPKEGDTAGGNRILITGENFRAKDLGQSNQQLPSVYFGGIKVNPGDITFSLPPKGSYEPLETTDILIVEKTPPGIAGKVDVTVINFDGATVTAKNGFEYKSKQVAITQVLPNQGSIYGGSEITVIGKDFVERGLHITFGSQKAQGDILSGTQQVKLGDLIVNYNAYAPENITLYYKNLGVGNELNGYRIYPTKDTVKKSSFKIIEEEEYMLVTIPWSELQGQAGYEAVANWADENTKIEVKGKNLIVTRGLGIVKSVTGGERIVLLTPPSPEVGEKTLTVFNQDGKSASSKFIYTNPYKSPVITKIIPTTDITTSEISGSPLNIEAAVSTPKGGSPLIIQGINFRAGVKVFIGNKEAQIKNKSANDDELIIIVPEAVAGTVGPYLRILVSNTDGGFTYGDTTELPGGGIRKPIYFRYIVEGSSPNISGVIPDKGPVTGGTKVTLKGQNFKDEDSFGNAKKVEVYIGGIPVAADKVTIKNAETIELIMPAGRVGKQTIEVVNYDFGRAIGTDIFTYISQPEILSVVPGKVFANDTNTEVVITGKMFQTGAKVIIGGKIIAEDKIKAGTVVNGLGIQGVDDNNNNKNVAVVEGKEAASIVVENELTLKVKFNETLDLTNYDIIIINPDGGVSKPYKEFELKVPVPNKPLVLEAIPGFESTVQLLWSESAPELLNASDRYEVYGKKATDKQYTLIGDTKGASYLVKALEPNTRYSFMVRALNKYGAAVDFAEVTVRTLSKTDDDKLKEKLDQLDKEKQKLEQEGKEEIIGGILVKTLGNKQVPTGNTPYVIDFSLTKYKDHNKFVVAIPLSTLQSINRQIAITDGKASFAFLPKDLFTREVSQAASKDTEDAHVRVVFERLAGKGEETAKTAVSRTQRQASKVYEISFELQVIKEITAIRRMMQKGSLDIKFDAMAYASANKDKLFVGEYDPSQDKFTKIGDGTRGYLQSVGKYMLLSER